MKGMSFNDLFIDAFNKLEVYYSGEAISKDGAKVSGGVSASYFGFKASLNAEANSDSTIKSQRAVTLPITPQTLAKYFGEANAIWIIEDFHKMNTEEKTKLSQVMKIFMDMSEKYNSVKIIAIGAVNTAREVVQYDPEMRNRVAEIHIPLMSKDELQEIIQVGTKLLNFAFSKDVSEKIAIYSCGMASVTHQLSLLICENEEVETTLNVDRKADDKSLDVAIDEYISETSDSLKHIYDIAVKCKYQRKYETPKEILSAILKNKKESVTIRDISTAIKKKHKEYKDNNLKKYVTELTTTERAEILRYDKNSDTYFFSTPFIKTYCLCVLNKDYDDSIITKAQLIENLQNTLHIELESAYEQFLKDFYSSAPTYYDESELDE